ncbi:MAG: MFS transporter [Clostridia bacterium]|nr:MFS transporter [Clostridia bacterium]
MENTTTTTVVDEVDAGTVENNVQEASTQDRRYLRPKEIAGFLLTSFGQKNLSQYVNAFRQFFAISFLGMSGSTYGLIMFIETIYDAVDDSISGLIIDRTRTRWGRLRPWLILPTPFWAIAMVMLFTTPAFIVHEWQKVIWTIVAIFVYNLGMSYFGAWTIMLYNITPNNNERDNLIATSKFADLFGVFLPSIASMCVGFLPGLTKNKVGMQDVYTGFAVIITVIAAFTAFYGFSTMRERVPLASREQMQEVGVIESFKNVFKNRPMFILVLSSFFASFKSVGVASESFYWMHNSKNVAHGSIAGLFTGIPNYIMVPLAPKLIRKFGARKVSILSGIFAGVAYTATFLIGICGNDGKGFLVNWEGHNAVINLAVLTFCLTVCGLPNQLLNVSGAVLQGDVYDYSEWKTGVRNEALVQTVQNYFGKAANSITNLLSGVVISAVGYVARKDEFGNIVPESNYKTLMGFWAIFCLLPAIARFLYGITLMFFNVDGDVKKQMLSDLEVSRRERLEKMNLEAEEEKIVEMNIDTHMGTKFPQEDNEEVSTDTE